jgi:TRAP transporter TAXI family solute receptor
MTKYLKFTTLSLRDLLTTFGPALVLLVLLAWLAYRLVDPFPPKLVTISTGQENGAHEVLARRYAAILARQGITVRLQRSEGSFENLQRLQDPDSGTDVAFVQSGSTTLQNSERYDLISLGSLFVEPIWLFYRAGVKIHQVPDLRGKHINVGSRGTGVPQMIEKLLEANGVQLKQVKLAEMDNTPATMALLAGKIDGMVFSSAPEAPLIQMLLQTPGIRLLNFSQADAYARRFPFLTQVTLPHGIVDLGRNVPARDYHLIAPTATLVARDDLHPALLDLLVQAAAEVHGGAGWFQKRGEFPNPGFTEVPVAESAEKFYKNGPPLLQHYMPFWLANFFERMWIVIVAFGALLVPLTRVVPPLYVWKVRSRIYRWYGQLRNVESAVEQAVGNGDARQRQQVYQEQMAALDDIERRVNQLTIPLSFAEELYDLRSHINFVRKRLAWLMQPDGARTAA